MSQVLDTMVVRLQGDGTSYQAMLRDAQRSTQEVTKMQGGVAGLSSSFLSLGPIGVAAIGSIAAAAGGLALGLSAISFVKWGAGLAAQAEQSQLSFEVMLGSAEKAKALMGSIRTFAAETPLETQGITEAATTLLNYQVAAENVMPMLKMLGDTSGGNSEKFKGMAVAFGQVNSRGKLMGEELNQMIERGFNPLNEISRMTGKSMGVLTKEMSAGKISAAMVAKAFESATSEGGRFHNLMSRQSKTVGGLWSTLQDNIAETARIVGGNLLGSFDIAGVLTKAISYLDVFNANLQANMTELTAWIGRRWKDLTTFISSTFGNVAKDGGNLFQYLLDTAMAWGTGTLGFFWNFQENVGIMWKWLGANWGNILTDMGTLFLTYVKNYLYNTVVMVETAFRLWQTFGGYLYGLWTKMFTVDFLSSVVSGLVAVGRYIYGWAKYVGQLIRDSLTGNFNSDTAAKIRGKLSETYSFMVKDFVDASKKNDLMGSFGDVLGEQFGKLKLNPLDGFVSAIKDGGPKFNTALKGMDLPKFTLAAGKTAGDNLSKGMLTGLGGMASAVQEATKVTDAVEMGTTEALARMQEFQAMRASAMTAATATVTANVPASQAEAKPPFERMASSLEKLVELNGIMAGEPTFQAIPADLA